MLSGLYSFSQIIEDVKQETGIQNLRNHYNSIAQLIARAEREINPYAGFYARKKMKYFKGNGTFNGTSIKKPFDFVSIDTANSCCNGSFKETHSHVIICDGSVRESVIFSYWAIQCDSEGRPIVTQNHAEAVVAYIVWKMYSPKVFMGEGNRGAKLDYKREFEDRLHEARGEDFFPSEDILYKMRITSSTSTIELNNEHCKDVCLCCESLIQSDEMNTEETINKKNVWYFQLDTPGEIVDVTAIDTQFLENRALSTNLGLAVQGRTYDYLKVGRFGFAIDGVDDNSIDISDILGASILSTLNYHYDLANRRIIFVSKEYVSQSSIYFKFSI